MSDASFLIVKTGTTLPELVARRGDYEDWIREGLGVPLSRVRVVRVYEGAALPDPRGFAGVVVTGSSALVSEREPWSERTAAWLLGVVEARVALLGICYGHQLIAQALGGRVGANPRGREIGSARVRLDPASAGDPLLGGLGETLWVHTTHVESVLELPPGVRCLGGNRADPHHVVAIGARCWGVQFHPEFDADVMRAYLEGRRELLEGEGLDVGRLLAEVRGSSDGTALLRRFSRIAAGADSGDVG